MYILIC